MRCVSTFDDIFFSTNKGRISNYRKRDFSFRFAPFEMTFACIEKSMVGFGGFAAKSHHTILTNVFRHFERSEKSPKNIKKRLFEMHPK